MVFQKSVHEKPIHGLMKTQDVENHMVQEFCWISHHTLWHFNLSLSSCSKLSLVSFSFSKVWRRGKGVWCGVVGTKSVQPTRARMKLSDHLLLNILRDAFGTLEQRIRMRNPFHFPLLLYLNYSYNRKIRIKKWSILMKFLVRILISLLYMIL